MLPATTFFEHKDLQPAYGYYYLQMSDQAIEPLGECRSNVEAFRGLAERMGALKVGSVAIVPRANFGGCRAPPGPHQQSAFLYAIVHGDLLIQGYGPVDHSVERIYSQVTALSQVSMQPQLRSNCWTSR